MKMTRDPYSEELADRQQEILSTAEEDSAPDTHQALAKIDAFVLAHSGLEFGEFFSQLRRLDAWHALVAPAPAVRINPLT
jgi:hypothetical protein